MAYIVRIDATEYGSGYVGAEGKIVPDRANAVRYTRRIDAEYTADDWDHFMPFPVSAIESEIYYDIRHLFDGYIYLVDESGQGELCRVNLEGEDVDDWVSEKGGC